MEKRMIIINKLENGIGTVQTKQRARGSAHACIQRQTCASIAIKKEKS